MCGITGMYRLDGRAVVKRELSAMMNLIAHRGPDDKGLFIDDTVGLGHQRLAIIDVKTGQQPMFDASKKYGIIFNGEIYNYKELQKKFLKDVQLQTKSDTEIILQLYIKYGTKAFQELNGMFAFAIYDKNEKELVLCRDRLGIKPLYLYKKKNVLLFSSEIKSFYGSSEFTPEPNLDAVKEYLTFSNIHNDISFFKDVTRLKPGTYTIIKGTTVKTKQYWDSTYQKEKKSTKENITQFKTLLDAAVKRHMISEVPLGSYLSGGIDSSSVATLANEMSKKPLHVFTGYFSDAPKYSELTCAQDVAKQGEMNHYTIKITPELFKKSIKDVVYALDEPLVGMGAFPQFHVSKLVAKKVTVVLTGHGGDELFAGYPLYKARLINNFFKHPLASLKALFKTKLSELAHIAYYTIYPLFQPEVKYGTFIMFSQKKQKKLFSKQFLLKTTKHDPFSFIKDIVHRKKLGKEDLTQEIYLKTYLPSLFVVEDKVGMAHSIEARTPICDNTLVDMSLRIPLKDKLLSGQLKAIPKEAMRAVLPKSLYEQPKKGFPTPLSLWFRKELKQYVEDILLSKRFEKRNIFNMNEIRRLLDIHWSGSKDGLMDYVNAARIWSLINVELWYQLFIDGEKELRR